MAMTRRSSEGSLYVCGYQVLRCEGRVYGLGAFPRIEHEEKKFDKEGGVEKAGTSRESA